MDFPHLQHIIPFNDSCSFTHHAERRRLDAERWDINAITDHPDPCVPAGDAQEVFATEHHHRARRGSRKGSHRSPAYETRDRARITQGRS